MGHPLRLRSFRRTCSSLAALVALALGASAQETADFEADVTSGDLPLTVSFTDLSSGRPDAWDWDFGDGGTSKQQNPTHQYSAGGFYTVSLRTTYALPFSEATVTKVGFITLTDFTATGTSGQVPLTATFTVLAQPGTITSGTWNFGDGTVVPATGPIQAHTYTTPGVYTVSLTLTGAGGSDTETKVDFVTASPPPPDLVSVSPGSGSPLGGTIVNLGGTNFNAGGTVTVTFGGVAAQVNSTSPTNLNCTTPAGAPGTTVEVRVTNSNGTDFLPAGFTYLSAPTVGSVAPSAGPVAGGTPVVLTGTNLAAGTNLAVTFGGQAATIQSSTATTVNCTTPAGLASGPVDVVVSNSNGSSTLAGGFTYLPVPDLVSLAPSSGTALGGTLVTLTGTGLGNGGLPQVLFGANAATQVALVNGTTVTCRTPGGTPGSVVDVRITTTNGTDTLAGGFTYNNAPDLVSLNPTSGTVLGGTAVRLSGTNFGGSPVVLFGGVMATVTASSATTIDCLTPVPFPFAGGLFFDVDVTVTTANGSDTLPNGYRYLNVPNISGITPVTGPPSGNTSVSISGFAFSLGSDPTVTFGGVPAIVDSFTDTTIQCRTPSGVPGSLVDVAVSNDLGSTTLTDAYTYFSTPVITGISPSSGTPLGGTAVTLTGENFQTGGAVSVTFGGAAATIVTSTGTSISCLTPMGTPGAVVDVVVSNGNGTATAVGGFTYNRSPVIASVVPSNGPAGGGTPVAINGTDLATGAAPVVTFGGVPATVTGGTPMQVLCTTPPGIAGMAVDVVVTTADGSGTMVGGFTYDAVTQPVVDFVGDVLSGPAPHTVVFTDLTTGTADIWLWEFGDGMSSKEQHPTHVYDDPGTYSVTLTVIGGGLFSDFETKTDYITVGEPVPVAAFSGNPVSGSAPLSVIFTDLSSGPVTAWSWDFGDGSPAATTQNPTHMYVTEGTFTVSLNVTGPGGADSATIVDYITVNEAAPVAEFAGTENLVADPFFAAGPNGGVWTETSTNFGTPLCSVATCGTGGGTGPAQGEFWCWFGGIGVPEIGSIEQTLTIPTQSTQLQFLLEIPVASGNGGDYLHVFIDGVMVRQITEQSGPFVGYVPIVVDISAFADGGSHVLRFESGISGAPTFTNFFVDAIRLGGAPGPTLTGPAPLSASFLDLSSGTVTSRSWDFGDLSPVSTEENPLHVFVDPGSYTVSLTVAGPAGTDTETKVDYVVAVVPAPVAEFMADTQIGDAPLGVAFSDLSSGPVTAWSWNFGDGSASTLQNPTQVYANPGTYTVSLVATGPGGVDTETKVNYITVEEPLPIARFKGTPTSGVGPFSVSFTDFSTLNIASWTWSFGDGVTSTLQHPTHTYVNLTPNTLRFPVSLMVTNVDGAIDIATKPNYITVEPQLPLAEFTADTTSGPAPLQVAFTDTSSGVVTAWSWNFGDKGTSNLQNPTHQFLQPGTYSVTLTATGPSGLSTETKADYITASGPPLVAMASAAPLTGPAPLTVTFTDVSSGAVASRTWDFDDAGAMSTELAPMYTFNGPGTYDVTLTVTGSAGGTDSDTVQIVVTEPAPIASFSGTPTSGPAPLTVNFAGSSLAGPVTDFLWNFGAAGGTSTLQTPSFTYTTPGTYTVSLMVTGPGGSDTLVRSDYITVAEPAPVAGFSATPTSGVAVLEVAFEDRSVGDVTSYSWDFGDGTASREENPTKFYQQPGTYTVSLTVVGPSGIDNETKVDYIVVQDPPPMAIFSGVPRAGTAPLTVQFIDFSTGPVVQWDWSFGDLETQTILSPPALDGSTSHTYDDPGTYTVALTVNGAGGNTETKVGYIRVLPPQPAVNDDCAAALTLECTDPTTMLPVGMADLGQSSTDASDPVPSCGPTAGGTLWYRIFPTGATVGVSARPMNAGDRVLVAIYDGTCGAGNLTELACDTSPTGGGGTAIAGASGLTPGAPYYVMVAALATATAGPVELTLSCLPLEPNDTCAGAIELFCGETLAANNRNATSELDDPAFTCASGGPLQGFGTLWYSFVANATSASLDTNASTVNDTLLAVYSGDCGTLTQLACSDDMGIASLSQLTATGLVPGERYFVQVATRGLEPFGQIQLSLDCAAPVNDACANAITLTPDMPFQSDNSTATIAALDPTLSCNGGAQGEGSIWFDFVAPASAVTLDASASPTAVNPILAAFDGTCGAFTEIGCSLSGTLALSGLTTGTTYYVSLSSATPADRGALILELRGSNDECPGAVEIFCGGTAEGDTSTATTALDDPGLSCHFSGPGTQGFGSVWYFFVATSTEAMLDTNLSTGSNDTLIGVYSGTCGALTEIGCSEDEGVGLLSELTVSGLNIGETYYVAVTAFSEGSAGAITLRLDQCNTVVANDECAGAAEILCGTSVDADTSLVTGAAAAPALSCFGLAPYGSRWFQFTATTTQAVLDTNLSTGSSDTLIGVYSGTCGALTEIGCSDNEGAGLLSRVSLTNLTLGATYHVVVGSKNAATAGAVTLRLDCTSPDPVVAEFSADMAFGSRPLVVAFTDESTGTVTSWSWDFGDGGTSTLANPNHSYVAPGLYDVTLTVANASSTDAETKTGFIRVAPVPFAQGTVPAKGVTPPRQPGFRAYCDGSIACLTVQFEDQSIGDWDRRFWIFGDDPGATFPTPGLPGSGNPDSTEVRPTHTYAAAGTYTVMLRVRRTVSPGVFEEATAVKDVVVVEPLFTLSAGSFETQPLREVPSRPWEPYGGFHQRVQPDLLPRDGDMPTHGDRWAEVSADGTRDAQPPSHPGGETRPPLNVAGLRQRFAFDPLAPGLAFEAAFLFDGELASAVENDFMSVDITDGDTWVNLYYADSFSEFPRVSEIHGLPMTAATTRMAWLDELFPRADGTTLFELEISIGNTGDDLRPSRGYVDHFRLLGEAHATVREGLGVNLACYESSPAALGEIWTARMSAAAAPNATLLILLAHERPSSGVLLPGMGELLIDTSSAELFALSQLPSSEGNVFATPIPDDAALAGLVIYTQGFLATGERVRACEAVDLKLGVARDR